jgi:hypothetical protein
MSCQVTICQLKFALPVTPKTDCGVLTVLDSALPPTYWLFRTGGEGPRNGPTRKHRPADHLAQRVSSLKRPHLSLIFSSSPSYLLPSPHQLQTLSRFLNPDLEFPFRDIQSPLVSVINKRSIRGAVPHIVVLFLRPRVAVVVSFETPQRTIPFPLY